MDRPEARAASSPSVIILSPGAAPAASTAATATVGATQATSTQLRFSTEPSSQFITSAEAMGDGDRLKIRAVAAPAKLDRATPNRIRTSGARTRAAMAIRTAPATPAPIRAETSTAPGTAASPRTMAAAAAKAAVAETPSTPGSASGLRNSPCITAPASPKAAPTNRAQTARGARTCHSTSPGPEWGSAKALEYSAAPNRVSPRVTAKASAARIAAARAAFSRIARLTTPARPEPPRRRLRTRRDR
ncbi:hypothetical protein D3C77_186090 [compost metagenome]